MMRNYLIILMVLLLVSCGGNRSNSARKEIIIGSKNFTESIILAEILAQRIEAATGLTVVRKFNLGGTFICHQALIDDQIDIYPEYTGTSLTAILKQPPDRDPKAVFEKVKQAYEKDFAVTAIAPFGFNNTFAILVRGEDARKLNLKQVSQIAALAPQWRAGFGYEFMERADGFPGFSAAYDLKFKETPKVMDLALTYRALAEKQVDLIAGNSTDGLIASLDLFMLNDDKNYFPPYEAVTLVRQSTLARVPNLKETLTKLGGQINEQEMQKLNGQVDVEHKDVKQVVKEFLEKKGL